MGKSTLATDVVHKLVFQHPLERLVALSALEIGKADDELRWHVFVVAHAQLHRSQHAQFLLGDEVQILSG